MAAVSMAVLGSIAVLGSCGNDPQPSVTTTRTGLANPASVFCVDQGGTVEIVDEASGQVGYCNLPDGRRIEEWELLNSQLNTVAP